MAARITAAFETHDTPAFGALLAEDVRWGADDAPNKCRSRRDVVATFDRLLAEGADGEVTRVEIVSAGILCQLRIHWPEGAPSARRGELVHLYRVQGGRIVEIEPYDDLSLALAALSRT